MFAVLKRSWVPPLISNLVWSAPPVMAKLTVSLSSASDAASTTTFWTFSAIEGDALEVNDGVSSLRSCTVAVTVMVSSSEPATPSETLITTTQTFALLPAPQPGVSKSGAEAKVSTPVSEAMLNRSWSTLVASVPEATME